MVEKATMESTSYIKRAEAARRWLVSERTIDNWRRRGIIASEKRGGRVQIPWPQDPPASEATATD